MKDISSPPPTLVGPTSHPLTITPPGALTETSSSLRPLEPLTYIPSAFAYSMPSIKWPLAKETARMAVGDRHPLRTLTIVYFPCTG